MPRRRRPTLQVGDIINEAFFEIDGWSLRLDLVVDQADIGGDLFLVGEQSWRAGEPWTPEEFDRVYTVGFWPMVQRTMTEVADCDAPGLEIVVEPLSFRYPSDRR